MLMWTAGDIALTIESLHGATPPTPSVADIFYIAFYPAAYLALALLLRRESSRLVPATWLDGAVAGLGAAALCAAFAFQSIVHLAGDGPAAVATELAYPVGDVLLLGDGGRRQRAHLGPALGRLAPGRARLRDQRLRRCVQHRPADHAPGRHRRRDRLAERDPRSCRVAVWVRPRPARRARPPGARPASCCPGSGRRSGLAILLYGSMHHVDPVALGLATATLVVVGVRLALSVRSLRALTEERHRQAVTDQLTGLGNRRRLAAVLDASSPTPPTPAPTARRLAFLFVDLDHFKEVNDSFGHPAGDQLLTQIGPRFQSCLAQHRPARADRRRRVRRRPARLGRRPRGARRGAAGGDARDAVRARHGERAHRRQHRHRPRARPRHDRRRPHALRRQGHVPGEAVGVGVRDLRPHARHRARPPAAGRRPARRHRPQRARAALPAPDRSSQRHHHRRRGAPALAAPAARLDPAARVPAAGRGGRT